MKKIFLAVTFLINVVGGWAQNSIDEVLQMLEQNSPTLGALKEQVKARQISNRTGIFLENPEVEFNYLWGHPSAQGVRMDVSVTQAFDFPSVYTYRNRISKVANNQVELQYKAERLDFLLQAKRICIDIVYYNRMIREYEKRKADAEALYGAYDRMLSTGEGNVLERNKAKLNLTEVVGQYELLVSQRQSLLTDLKRLNGGKDVSLEMETYALQAIPADFEAWYATAEPKSPVLQYVSSQIEMNKSEVKLGRALSLPKFSAGYMNEHITGDGYGGLKLGMSVPLWENRNKVKAARAEGLVLARQAEDARLKFYYDLRAQFDKVQVYRRMAASYRETLSEQNGIELLNRTLEGGEISLIDYLQELGLYYDNVSAYIEAERNAELAMAELTAVEL